jgi:hypothetical protein
VRGEGCEFVIYEFLQENLVYTSMYLDQFDVECLLSGRNSTSNWSRYIEVYTRFSCRKT